MAQRFAERAGIDPVRGAPVVTAGIRVARAM